MTFTSDLLRPLTEAEMSSFFYSHGLGDLLPVFARFSKAITSNCNALVSSGPASIPYILVSSANSLVLQWMYSNYV